MTRFPMDRSVVTRVFAWSAFFMAVVSLSACASKQYIAIPPEWQTLQPPAQPSTLTPSQAKQKPPVPAPPQDNGPIIKRTPQFKEMDLPKSSDSPASTVIPKNGEPQVQPQSQPQVPSPPPLQQQPQPQKPERPPQPQQPPQRLASMHLVDQAKMALGQGKPDAAIPLLEQAIQVDVYNGEAFWGLARAWRAKGAPKKSLEFARKAEILFQNEPSKLKEVYRLEADLYKEIGDPKKAESYRQKASKL